MKKIIIATDGSPSAQEAVGVGIELAAEQGAAVTFVHVLPADEFVVAGRMGHIPKAHRVDMDESEVALHEAAAHDPLRTHAQPSMKPPMRRRRPVSSTPSSASPATRSMRSSPWRTPRTPT